MATSYVHPSEIWIDTSILFSVGGTSPPHWENNAFIRGCAFKHIAILVCPLPSYQ